MTRIQKLRAATSEQDESASRERLARLEEGQTSMRGEISELSRNVSKLASAVQSMSRPNWQVWVGVVGIVCILVTGGVSYVNTEIDKTVTPLAISVRSESQTRDVQWAVQHRMDVVLWNASPLGKITKYPETPYYYPENITGK